MGRFFRKRRRGRKRTGLELIVFLGIEIEGDGVSAVPLF